MLPQGCIFILNKHATEASFAGSMFVAMQRVCFLIVFIFLNVNIGIAKHVQRRKNVFKIKRVTNCDNRSFRRELRTCDLKQFVPYLIQNQWTQADSRDNPKGQLSLCHDAPIPHTNRIKWSIVLK